MDPDWAKALAFIAAEEAFVEYPYDDCDPHYPHPRWTGGDLIGTATIGYGETDPEVVGRFVSSGETMTEDEASALLGRRLPGYWEGTRDYFTVDLNPNQAAAVLSMAYNAGPAGMKMYAPDLLAAINEGRFDHAAEIWKTSIVTANGVRLPGLERRRSKEAALFATPIEQPPPPPPPEPPPPPPPPPDLPPPPVDRGTERPRRPRRTREPARDRPRRRRGEPRSEA